MKKKNYVEKYGELLENVIPEEIIGKLIIIGITVYNSDKKIVDRFQTHGIAEKVQGHFLLVRKKDDNIFRIPLLPLIKAKPGKYKENNSDVIIENPDFLAQYKFENINNAEIIEKIKKHGMY